VDREHADVGIVVPLEAEFDQLVDVFGKHKKVDVDFAPGTVPVGTYWRLPGPGGMSVVAVLCWDMGPEWAAIATERLFQRFDVDVICQVGIAGALSRKLQLGDVVVPKAIWAYHQSGKVTEIDGKTHWHLGSRDFPLSDHIIDVVRNLRMDPDNKPLHAYPVDSAGWWPERGPDAVISW
jgi:hypothetical protein